MDVRVRRAREDELDEVGRLTAEANAVDGVITAEDPYADNLRDTRTRQREGLLLVAEAPDGELLGTVTVVPADSPFVEMCRPGEVEVRMLAVAASARGRGVGELLTRACVDVARDEGAERVVLSSGPWMTAAHRLYERFGFTRVPERDWKPRPDVDLIAYALDLGD